MDFTYNGKPIMPTKTAMDELSDIDLDLYEVPKILEEGFELRKRKKNVIETTIFHQSVIGGRVEFVVLKNHPKGLVES